MEQEKDICSDTHLRTFTQAMLVDYPNDECFTVLEYEQDDTISTIVRSGEGVFADPWTLFPALSDHEYRSEYVTAVLWIYLGKDYSPGDNPAVYGTYFLRTGADLSSSEYGSIAGHDAVYRNRSGPLRTIESDRNLFTCNQGTPAESVVGTCS